ncbi:MAG: ankyrin repeat domain-containing protein [Chloroflexi bacterium]|nr:ankyrin repeat domain-containing protein [Chloroflexota bacterium]
MLGRGVLLVVCACSIFLALVLATACGGLETSPETDRAALTLLYQATDGPNWIRRANWLTDAPLDQWEGVTTDENGRVIGLDLYRNNVSGVIPTDVGNLDKLQVFNVANTSDHLVSDVAEIIVGFASLLELVLTGDTTLNTRNPPEYNDLYGCLPSRLQGQLDSERSNLGGRGFCDGANEAVNTNTLALEYAVLKGDVAAVQRLVRDGADVACINDSGPTALHAAVAQGNVEITRVLAEQCAEDLDDASSGALYELALDRRTPVIVQVLLDAGVDFPCTSDSDPTLLHVAVADEHVELARTVAEQCSELLNTVSTSYFDEQTPLSLAIERGNQELVRILIEAGADPNVRVLPDYEVGSHLAYAVEEGDAAIVTLLLEAGADPNVSDADLGAPGYRETPLARAYHNDRADLVRMLVDAGADLGATGNAMLSAAIINGKAEMVSALVEVGVEVSGRDARGRSMLERAMVRGSAEIVATLVEAGADPNATDADGEHILFDAILHGGAEIVGILVDAGADANATDAVGEPVLFYALLLGSAETVEVLVDAGADVNARDKNGRSVLGRARLFNDPEVISILVNAGAKE